MLIWFGIAWKLRRCAIGPDVREERGWIEPNSGTATSGGRRRARISVVRTRET